MASITEPVNGVVEWIDRLQRRHPLLGFPYAVIKRYGEDHGGWLGALISYYGFFSLYPLLVVFTTIASWVLKDRPETLQTVLEALWSRVPFVSDALSAEVAAQVERLTGHGWVLSSPCSSSCGVASAWSGSSRTRSTRSGESRVTAAQGSSPSCCAVS